MSRKLAFCLALLGAVSFAEELDEDFSGPRAPGEQIGNEGSVVDPGVGISNFNYSGTGCPPGTVASTITEDKRTLSVLFSAFNVDVAAGTNPQAIKQCQMLLDLKVPPNMRAAIVRVDYRGFNKLPMGANSVLNQSYIIEDLSNGLKSPRLMRRKIFQGPIEQDFMVTAPIRKQQHWSRCGENFRVNLGVLLRVNNLPRKDAAMAVIDSMDQAVSGRRRAQYSLLWQRCSDGGNRPDRPERPGHGRPGHPAPGHGGPRGGGPR